MWSVYKGEHHVQDLELHARYGKVVRVAPNLVSVADTNEINQLYGITTKFIKSPFYDLSAVHDEDGLVPDPFVIRNDKTLHSRMKRNAANAYSLNGLIQVEPWVEPVISRFVGILDDHAQANAICDLGELLKRFAMDAVCSLTFGSDFGYLEKGDELNFFKSIDLFTAYMSIVSIPSLPMSHSNSLSLDMSLGFTRSFWEMPRWLNLQQAAILPLWQWSRSQPRSCRNSETLPRLKATP